MKQKFNPSNVPYRNTKKIVLYLLIVIFCFTSACGKKENTTSSENTAVNNVSIANPGSGDNGAYMDKNSWELAKAELKTIDEVIKAFNGFYDVWGWAYEHRVFNRYKEALETADYLPGKMDEVVKLVSSIKTVQGYPEIDSMKECYLNMIPLLRAGAQNLKESIVAARDKNGGEEKKQVNAYTDNWKKAMEYSRQSFAIMQDTLTRGGRTEYQNLTGEKKTTVATAAAFRTKVKKIVATYDSSVVPKTAEIKKLITNAGWDGAMVKTDYLYSVLQSSIMEAGQADPGNRKELLDARQELISTLSQQMMAMKKMREYTEKMQSGNTQEGEQAMKVYEILRKSALEARSRLKKTGY